MELRKETQEEKKLYQLKQKLDAVRNENKEIRMAIAHYELEGLDAQDTQDEIAFKRMRLLWNQDIIFGLELQIRYLSEKVS